MSTQDRVFGPKLDTQQKQGMSQRLMMSAHMQQALHLLQLPLMEMEPFIEEQVANNPILEITNDAEEGEESNDQEEEKDFSIEQEIKIDEGDFTVLRQLEEDFREHFEESGSAPIKRNADEEKFKTYLESSICAETSLYDHLIHEVHENFEDPQQIKIAELLMGYIDEYGFLKTPLEEIATLEQLDLPILKEILLIIQTFEPYGIGASSTQETLLIQLKCLKKENTLAYQIVKDHYDALLHHRLNLIQKEMGNTLQEIQQAIEQDIAKLDLHPGTHYSPNKTQTIVPDVIIREDNNELIVDVNRDYAPSLRLNHKYFRMLEDPTISLETKQYIKRRILSARWLVRNIQQRYSTIERIAMSLTRRQKEYFSEPTGKLVPLTMKALAEELEVHESTIARTVSNKYIDTPRGILPLRAFFTTEYKASDGAQLSSKTIQEAIEDLINKENKRHPFSDEKISNILQEQGIPCARRTVAKHRALLNIGNTQQRRRF